MGFSKKKGGLGKGVRKLRNGGSERVVIFGKKGKHLLALPHF